jgi:PAS domain S-box-containing protein
VSERLRFDSVRHTRIFLCVGIFLAPFLFAFADAAFVTTVSWKQGNYWELWRVRFLSHALATLVFVPVILSWNLNIAAAIRKMTLSNWLAMILWALVLLVVCSLEIVMGYSDAGVAPLLLLAFLPLLVWAAVYYNSLIVSTAFLVATGVAIWGGTHGSGASIGGSALEAAMFIQLFFIGVGVLLLLLSATMQERRQVQAALLLEVLEHRKTEVAQGIEAARFSKVFRLNPDAMMISCGMEGRILDVNDRWEHLFGYSRDEVIGCNVSELHLYASGTDSLVARNHDGNREREMNMRDKEGKIRQTIFLSEEIAGRDEPCFISIIRDISELRRAELQTQEQRAQLIHLARVAVLGKLSGAFAHELNQPLTAILSNAQAARRVVAKEPVNLDEIRDILQDIGDEGKRAGEIIRRLRALFMKGAPELQLLNLNEVVTETLELARTDLISRKMNVSLHLKPGLTAVRGDWVQLQQVLLNLIINACEAMNGNVGEQREIRIFTQDGADSVKLAVTDNGHGIATDAMDRLFESFFTTKAHGLGFGLSISHTIVAEHGGHIEAMNNPGGGATFNVILPAHFGAHA